MSLKGRRAIVTGSSGALGSIIAQRFLAEGALVAGSHRDPKKEDAGETGTIKSSLFRIPADVTDESQVASLFTIAAEKMGGVDIVVNTVGGFLPRTEIPDITLTQWNAMMDINLKSTFLCTREALRRMKGKAYGRIVNISAMTGLRPSPGRAAYAVSKSAVALFTEIAAQEQKGTGITINAIAPSIIDTEANRKSMPDEDHAAWVKPEHIADIICYLCSDVAKDVTGTIIKAYGGV